ncbi:hypothetical protein AB0E70_13530 [Streptomyces murinus]|uniref:hypothetical protein n=1 Tax=Streptomyces murinus TaxID=33900 RepID=UPI0013029449|nr:hypothetical protein [Streptomyces murinus]
MTAPQGAVKPRPVNSAETGPRPPMTPPPGIRPARMLRLTDRASWAERAAEHGAV